MSRGQRKRFLPTAEGGLYATRPKVECLKSTYVKRGKMWKQVDGETGETERDRSLRAEIFGEFRRYGVMPCLWRDMK